MERWVYLCDWLPPDFGAVGQYALLTARRLAFEGKEVTLFGLSSSGASVEDARVGAGRLRVERLAASSYRKSSLAKRLGWTLRTNLRLLRAAWSAMREADTVLFTGSPPFLVHFVVPANAWLQRRLVYRITDFHPECLIAELGRAPWCLRSFRAFTFRLRRRVDRFEVLGEDQARRLREIGIDEDRIELARDDSPVAIDAGTEAMERPLGAQDKVLLLYSGNLGVAHDDGTFLDGYEEHHQRGSARVVFWLNATGAKADRVSAVLTERALPFFRGHQVPLEALASLLVTPDAHLITLRDEFVGYVLPSKVYGCIASRRMVLFIGSAESDVDLLCRARMSGDLYWRVDVGDVSGAARALEAIADRAARGPRAQ